MVTSSVATTEKGSNNNQQTELGSNASSLEPMAATDLPQAPTRCGCSAGGKSRGRREGNTKRTRQGGDRAGRGGAAQLPGVT